MLLSLLLLVLHASVSWAEVHAFSEAARTTKKLHGLDITFAAKAPCDATVAIEDKDGRIIRHLASGLLGENAPLPFQKNSLKQTVYWDGKDDLGNAVDPRAPYTVRVSLGLKPRFEKTLYWSPYRRCGRSTAKVRASPEGVYVADGERFNQVRLFDHSGNYLRTVYPFPAEKMKKITTLQRVELPPDKEKFPAKWGDPQTSLLTYSDPRFGSKWPCGGPNGAVSAMDVRDGHLVLAGQRVNHLLPSGDIGPPGLDGPKVSFRKVVRHMHGWEEKAPQKPPQSVAISPDGKWVYLSGYLWRNRWIDGMLPGVARLALKTGASVEVFLGKMSDKAEGTDNKRFINPTSVACDQQNRVYVSDFGNDRVQIFSPEDGHLKTIRITKPAAIRVSPKTGEIFVLSWSCSTSYHGSLIHKSSKLHHFGPFEAPKRKATYTLDLEAYKAVVYAPELRHGEVDTWTNPPSLWISHPPGVHESWFITSVQILRMEAGNLKLTQDFNAITQKMLGDRLPPFSEHQKLYVGPRDGSLYINESFRAHGKTQPSGFPRHLARVDPETGRVSLVALPFNSVDFAFDPSGLMYLRTNRTIARYDPKTSREIPLSQGEERPNVGVAQGEKDRQAPIIGGIPTPYRGASGRWLGGLGVSPRGNVVVSCYNPIGKSDANTAGKPIHFALGGQRYRPESYPGRASTWEIHAFDDKGKLLHADVLPGVGWTYGVMMDSDGCVYVLSSKPIRPSGKAYANPSTGTLIKVRPGSAKLFSAKAPIPLPDGRMKRPSDLGVDGDETWLDGAEWVYGGITRARPALDAFARAFVSEADRYRIAVLDKNGNVILRLGRYGNVDDGLPLDKANGPPEPRSIGGDEVALMHPMHLAVHSDRRLFIADFGNQRVLSVKLGYHSESKTPVTGVTSARSKR